MSSDEIALEDGLVAISVRDGQVADVSVAGCVVIDGIYGTVRDDAWNTIAPEVSGFRLTEGDGSFAAVISATYSTPSIRFDSTLSVAGGHGVLEVVFEGVAAADFEANRVGLCILHPMALVGSPFVATTTGGIVRGEFPQQVSPTALVTDMTGLAYQGAEGSRVEISFDGQRFEMEDHRNWTDPGWKSYCPPLAVRHPFLVHAGRPIRQAVTIRATPGTRTRHLGHRNVGDAAVHVTAGEIGVMPKMGVVLAPTTAADSAHQQELLERIAPEYLHVELRESDPCPSVLSQAAEIASAVGAGLTLSAVGETDYWYRDVAETIAAQAVDRVCIVDATSFVTREGTIASVRDVLRAAGSATAVGGGSILHFAELNRMSASKERWEFVSFPVTPQAHHHDDLSIMATASAQPYALDGARSIAGDVPVVVAPVSFRRRRTPFTPASWSDPVDPREGSDMAAAWMLATTAAMSNASGLTWLIDTLSRRPGRPDIDLLRWMAKYVGKPLLLVDLPSAEVAVLAVRSTADTAEVRLANLVSRRQVVRVNDTSVELSGYGADTVQVVVPRAAEQNQVHQHAT